MKLWKSTSPPATPEEKPLVSLPARYDIAALKRRLAALPADDPLRDLLHGFLNACISANANVRCGASEEANQLVGRINMLSDLVADWDELWRQTHPAPARRENG
jgi:hypothetical protein